MLNETKQNLLKLLEEKWSENSDERFGQFLFNHSRFGSRVGLGMVEDPFYFLDEDIIKDLEDKVKNYWE